MANRRFEEEVQDRGWRFAPILIPAPVNGWEFAEQNLLCVEFPLERTGLRIATLTTHKSIACLIGMGPDFESTEVGSPYKVFAGRYDGQLRRQLAPSMPWTSAPAPSIGSLKALSKRWPSAILR